MDSITMPEFVELVRSNLQYDEIKTVVEVGSLDGQDSLYFKQEFPDSEVYTIEGLPDNYNTFLKDEKTINTFNTVITDYNGVVDFHVKEINGIHGIYNRGDFYGTGMLTLPCVTLDKLCEDNMIDSIDVMKIDVEGATYDVLKGMSVMLSKTKIMHIETEFFEFFEDQKLHDVVEKLLKDNNFELLKMTYAPILENKIQSDSVWINRNLI